MSNSFPRPVSCPAKAFLMGEYAVLRGAPAWLAAVDVRATAYAPRASFGECEAVATPIVAAATDHVRRYLTGHARTFEAPAPSVDTARFHHGGRKLGLGSSAAVAAAVVGYYLRAAGLSVDDPEIRGVALRVATAAHREVQPRGSGADVAAAVLGGILRFEAGDAVAQDWPEGLVVGLVDSGAPASTPELVKRVLGARERDPAEHDRAISRIRAASERFGSALAAPDGGPSSRLDATRHACAEHNAALRTLSALSGAPLMTPALETIVRAAEGLSVAAKPSGAAGGDLAVVFADSQASLDRLAVRLLRGHGLALLGHVQIGAPGLREEALAPLSSRVRGFFAMGVASRRQRLTEATGIPSERFDELDAGGIDLSEAAHMIENVIGGLTLPLGVATNFRINGRDYFVPMCVEESSVVAAASNAAKMVREGGGFVAHADPPWMIAQVQLVGDDRDAGEVANVARGLRSELLARADAAHPRLVSRGGGARDVEVRVLDERNVVVHVLVDCRDAMGANLINTVAEAVAPTLERATGWRCVLRILSNLSDRRITRVTARVPVTALAGPGWSGADVAERIAAASHFADCDPYRAATHNKGIMNGVDAVVLATGNDWRAIEAGAHAFACRDGQYRPLATWSVQGDELCGDMQLPTAVGVVGGLTTTHRSAKVALDLLGRPSATELGRVIAATGLASNLAALRALATDGIQRGHMSLHARTLAFGAGAIGEEVDQVAEKLVSVGEIKPERAESLLRELRGQKS
ncbi:MAG: hydroxymethylglutaryl-CoA reductase, degradative [Myxococcales bacterium FL481]|nr:MAG: hydroxymethylglutaryl-CoA reductase, degradative [Myxococcales bacterium FL481]